MNLFRPPIADRRLLPEGRLAGPMPWIIGIMTFLTMLSAAAGIGLTRATEGLGSQLAGRVTVQIVEPNPDLRELQAQRVLAQLTRTPMVANMVRVDDRRMRALLQPWLGSDGLGTDLPVPVLIDVDLRSDDPAAFEQVRRGVVAVSPSARVDEHAQWLGPLQRLLSTLRWLAVTLVLMIGGATAAAVILSARTAFVTHRATIDVMHMMGASDAHISRLFERRAALDTLTGSLPGVVCGVLVIIGISARLNTVGAAVVDQGGLGFVGWLILLLLPIAAVGIAVVTARWTITRALGQSL